jgi:hypothetical protein
MLTTVPPFSLKLVTLRLDRLGVLKSGHSFGAHCTLMTLSTGGAAAVKTFASSPKATLSLFESSYGGPPAPEEDRGFAISLV